VTHSDCNTLLAELRTAGVSVWIDEEALIVMPASKLTPDQIAALKTNKRAILAAHRAHIVDLLPSSEVCEQWRRRYCNTNRERTP